MNFNVIGFIDNTGTRAPLEQALPTALWTDSPEGDEPPCDRECVVILHVSQGLTESKSPYECIKECITSLLSKGQEYPDFPLFISWMQTYGKFIRAVIVTSGGPIEQGKINVFARRLEPIKIRIFGFRNDELALLLKNCYCEDIPDFIACLEGDLLEPACQALSAAYAFELAEQMELSEPASSAFSEPFEKAVLKWLSDPGNADLKAAEHRRAIEKIVGEGRQNEFFNDLKLLYLAYLSARDLSEKWLGKKT